MSDADAFRSNSPTCSSARRSTARRASRASPLDEIATPAADRQARAPRDGQRRAPVRHAPLRRRRARSSASTPPPARPARRPTSRSPRSDLDNWVTGSARSYAASGLSQGHARDHDLQRGAVRRRRGARGLRPHRRLPHPDGHRQHRARADGDRAPRARRGRRHAVVRDLPRRDAATSRGSSVTKVLVAGEPGGGEPGFRTRAAKQAGARRSPRRWGSATSASRCGASASTRTGCTSARTASSTRS